MNCVKCNSSMICLFMCDKCHIRFTKKYVWEIHASLTGHICYLLYSCECRHPRTHSIFIYDYKYSYQCPICGKQCLSEGGLSNHMNSCQVKNKIFIDSIEIFEYMDTSEDI